MRKGVKGSNARGETTAALSSCSIRCRHVVSWIDEPRLMLSEKRLLVCMKYVVERFGSVFSHKGCCERVAQKPTASLSLIQNF